jgi:integrase
MILVAHRHGLRTSEVCDLRWEQIDWKTATLHVRRVKSGKPSTHPIRGDELRALRKLQREAPKSPFIFVSERGGPFTTDSFNWMIKRAGQKISIPFQVHSHMAAPRSRLQAGWSPYTINPGLPWAQEHPAHRALRRAVADQVQRFLARLGPAIVLYQIGNLHVSSSAAN